MGADTCNGGQLVEEPFTRAMAEAVKAYRGDDYRKHTWLAATAVFGHEHASKLRESMDILPPSEITFWSQQLLAGVTPKLALPGDPKAITDEGRSSSQAHLPDRASCVVALLTFGHRDLATTLLPGVTTATAQSYPISVEDKEILPGSPEDHGLTPWPIPALSLGKWCSSLEPFQDTAAVYMALFQGSPEAAERKAVVIVRRALEQKKSRREGRLAEVGGVCRALTKWPAGVDRPDGVMRLLLGAYQNPIPDDYVAALRALALAEGNTQQAAASILSRAPQLAELRKVRGVGIVNVLWSLPWEYLEPLVQKNGSELNALLLGASFEDVTRLRMCTQDHPDRAKKLPSFLFWVPAAQAAWMLHWESVVRQYERMTALWQAIQDLPILPARKWAAAYLLIHPSIQAADPIKLIVEVDAEATALLDDLRASL